MVVMLLGGGMTWHSPLAEFAEDLAWLSGVYRQQIIQLQSESRRQPLMQEETKKMQFDCFYSVS